MPLLIQLLHQLKRHAVQENHQVRALLRADRVEINARPGPAGLVGGVGDGVLAPVGALNLPEVHVPVAIGIKGQHGLAILAMHVGGRGQAPQGGAAAAHTQADGGRQGRGQENGPQLSHANIHPRTLAGTAWPKHAWPSSRMILQWPERRITEADPMPVR